MVPVQSATSSFLRLILMIIETVAVYFHRSETMRCISLRFVRRLVVCSSIGGRGRGRGRAHFGTITRAPFHYYFTVCNSPGTSRAFRVTSLNISKTSDGRAYDFRERIAENGARIV